ncbi:hypothetical protein [Pseudaquidulcibacter saccharophilus]|uniref:hypothetical protein n=1 Tax=Pseudaquidulcibacter saccharophilus TaxID=2831900 RepID=UPI001EFF376A|nr:hypothetical protein [Pseudaquidulcibacter saccharophilus]
MRGIINHLFSNKLSIDISLPVSCPQPEREINSELLSLVLEHADICRDAGAGCVALKVSRAALKQSHMRRIFGKYIDKVCNITIIWNELTASVVTVIHHSLRVN